MNATVTGIDQETNALMTEVHSCGLYKALVVYTVCLELAATYLVTCLMRFVALG